MDSDASKAEALRLKAMAEDKIQSQDYTIARALILEAQRLFLALEHASEMFTVCDILCAAQLELPGCGINWYWVMQLLPLDDATAIADQYKKLLSQLEPIKDDFAGTGLAVKYIGDAYSVLSNLEKRAAFDSKRVSAVVVSGESSLQIQTNAGVNANEEVAVDGALVVGSVGKSPPSPEYLNCSDGASFTDCSDPSTSTRNTGVPRNHQIQNLKPKWSSRDFSAEQVWAVYGGPDVMPRLYVRVNDVVTLNRVYVTFLEAHPMLDEEIHWVEESLPVVCGVFRTGNRNGYLEISRFSHLVKCDKSSKRTFYRIFPRKGEVWAMYKNWSCSWKKSDFRSAYQYHVVEIISDFSDENGLIVCNLIEVKDYLTLFQRHLQDGYQLTRPVSRLGLLSFSHRIPALTVVDIRNQAIPNGSWHLEPDALPPRSLN